jgi:hypothetical protein
VAKVERNPIRNNSAASAKPEESSELRELINQLLAQLKKIGAVPTERLNKAFDNMAKFRIEPKQLLEFFDPANEPEKSPTALINNWRSLSSSGYNSIQNQVRRKIKFFLQTQAYGIKFAGLFIDGDGEIYPEISKC